MILTLIEVESSGSRLRLKGFCWDGGWDGTGRDRTRVLPISIRRWMKSQHGAANCHDITSDSSLSLMLPLHHPALSEEKKGEEVIKWEWEGEGG